MVNFYGFGHQILLQASTGNRQIVYFLMVLFVIGIVAWQFWGLFKSLFPGLEATNSKNQKSVLKRKRINYLVQFVINCLYALGLLMLVGMLRELLRPRLLSNSAYDWFGFYIFFLLVLFPTLVVVASIKFGMKAYIVPFALEKNRARSLDSLKIGLSWLPILQYFAFSMILILERDSTSWTKWETGGLAFATTAITLVISLFFVDYQIEGLKSFLFKEYKHILKVRRSAGYDILGFHRPKKVDLESVIKYSSKSIDTFPSSDAYCLRGLSFSDQAYKIEDRIEANEKYELALSDFTNAIEIEDQKKRIIELYDLRSYVNWQLDNSEKTIADIERLFKLSRKSRKQDYLHYRLADSYKSIGSFEESITSYQTYYNLKGNKGKLELFDKLAEVHQLSGNLELAEKSFLEGFNASDNDQIKAEYLKKISVLNKENGDTKKALEYLYKAAIFSPHYHNYLDIIDFYKEIFNNDYDQIFRELSKKLNSELTYPPN